MEDIFNIVLLYQTRLVLLGYMRAQTKQSHPLSISNFVINISD